MKDDPNNEVMADSVIAGDVSDRIKARRGYAAAWFERQCHYVKL